LISAHAEDITIGPDGELYYCRSNSNSSSDDDDDDDEDYDEVKMATTAYRSFRSSFSSKSLIAPAAVVAKELVLAPPRGYCSSDEDDDDDADEQVGDSRSQDSSRSSLPNRFNLLDALQLRKLLHEAGVFSDSDESDSGTKANIHQCDCVDNCFDQDHERPLPPAISQVRDLIYTMGTYETLALRSQATMETRRMFSAATKHNPRGFNEIVELKRLIQGALHRGDTVVNLLYPNGVEPSEQLLSVLDTTTCQSYGRYYGQRLMVVRKRVRPYGCTCYMGEVCSCESRGMKSRIQLEINWSDYLHPSPRKGSVIDTSPRLSSHIEPRKP
jgi:hypothetical protein